MRAALSVALYLSGTQDCKIVTDTYRAAVVTDTYRAAVVTDTYRAAVVSVTDTLQGRRRVCVVGLPFAEQVPVVGSAGVWLWRCRKSMARLRTGCWSHARYVCARGGSGSQHTESTPRAHTSLNPSPCTYPYAHTPPSLSPSTYLSHDLV